MILTHQKVESRVLLNLGCGLNRPQGWINADSSLNSLLQKYPIVKQLIRKLHKTTMYENSNVIFMDLRNHWKFQNNSVDVVYASHIFEHLTLKSANLFMNEAYRVLRQNGAIRIVVPDLYQLAKTYIASYERNNDKSNEEFLYFVNLHKEGAYLEKRNWLVKILNFLQEYPHQHKYMYDALSIKRILQCQGFVNIHESNYGESKHISEIQQVEFTKEGVASIYIEAQKI